MAELFPAESAAPMEGETIVGHSIGDRIGEAKAVVVRREHDCQELLLGVDEEQAV